MNAQEVVLHIGIGVKRALEIKELFLGIEKSQFENVDISPEYVMTVKIAESFINTDHTVLMEAQMSALRRKAIGLNRIYRMQNKKRKEEVQAILESNKFRVMDGKRLDILVDSSDDLQPPHLVAEAKLGIGNISGVCEDINRIVHLLDMYNELEVPKYDTYGAVVFHVMGEGDKADNLSAEASDFLGKVDNHLKTIQNEFGWLQCQSGLLEESTAYKGVSVYEERYEDGSSEKLFAKDKFSLSPGLILLGKATDILDVKF